MFSGLKVREPEKLSPPERRLLQEVLEVVENHLSEKDFNVTRLCFLLGVSRVTVHRRLKSIAGKSATEFIRSIKLHYAASLLKNEKLPVRQAARLSGFYNLSYFSKCFREEFGVRPSEYSSKDNQQESINHY